MSDAPRTSAPPAAAPLAPSASSPPPAPGPAGPPRAPTQPFEFDEVQKESFASLAASMSFVGVCGMLFAALSVLFVFASIYAGAAVGAIAFSAMTAVMAITSWWTVSAGRSLSAMVRTRGRDVENLMAAVTQLRRLFGMQRILVILVAMAMAAGFAGAVWCAFVVDRGGRCFGVLG
jgi:hypothetical protein